MTTLNESTSDWLAGMQPLNLFILQPSLAELDKVNIVTEFIYLLGLTVLNTALCGDNVDISIVSLTAHIYLDNLDIF